MRAIKISDNLGNIKRNLVFFLKKYFFNIKPNKVGKNTINSVDLIIFWKLTSIDWSARKRIINGVNTTEEIVEIIVQVIDNATLPLHKYVITFDAVPPGHEPRIIKPRPISKSILKNLITSRAIIGIIVNWITRAVRNQTGFLNTFFISDISIVTPIPNITKPKRIGMYDFKFAK